jgi:phosphatidylserine/phosphatidylglycerophosphate/cardiolipin synthase-like enzyme
VRARFEHAVGFGRRTPIPDQEVALVRQGTIVAHLMTRAGEAELPEHCRGPAYGVFRTGVRRERSPVAAVEQRIEVIGPPSKPLILFDAELPEADLAMLAASPAFPTHEHLAVRIRPMQSCRAIRLRLHEAGFKPLVVDCRMVLDEGEALDVPDVVDAVRLARVAARLRARGFPVVAVVHRAHQVPVTVDFAALRAGEMAAHRWSLLPPPAVARSVGARLEACAAAPPLSGHRVAVELDNVLARRWLLEAIETARRRIHLQVYMVADDDIGQLVEASLARAGARGVAVRVLVDSLHGMHGSLGASNPILERIGACPGVELRLSAPIVGMPTLQELKQRDHRKLVVVDNQLALLGGRNISHQYYTGFDEVSLTPESTWRQVPWLDAGARIEGPVVERLEQAFLEVWAAAGGSSFDIAPCPPAGDVPARLVLHRGLRDAYALEAYLALIDGAASHVDVVNGFPLILEIQHALLRALRRGVKVRTLFGHLTPTHGNKPFDGPWSSARNAATAFVHSRMDALVEAGGEARQFAMDEQPSWKPGLGAVNSHVHAKLMSVDGRICAVGSANMDITAGYWESELLLVLEDAPIAAATEAWITRLMAGSLRVRRDDPEWQALARRREWLRYWPGVLSI